MSTTLIGISGSITSRKASHKAGQDVSSLEWVCRDGYVVVMPAAPKGAASLSCRAAPYRQTHHFWGRVPSSVSSHHPTNRDLPRTASALPWHRSERGKGNRAHISSVSRRSGPGP